MLTLKATAVWLVILVCAALNGGLREALLIPALGKPLALVVSGTLWPVVLAVTFVAPLLAVRVRGKPAQ